MHFESDRLQNFTKAYAVFQREFYYENTEIDETEPYLCNLHNAFGLSTPTAHDCLGCNFADLTTAFDSILSSLADQPDIFSPCVTYIFWLYLFVERYDQIMNRVSVPDGYKKRHFKTLQSVRRWANFIKHPKAFLFSHHPDFYHGGEMGDDFVGPEDSVTINQEFIDTYYSGSSNNNKLYKILSNASKVIVVFPGPEQLMENFAIDTKKFVRLIEHNEVYREELEQITTIEEFFIEIDE